MNAPVPITQPPATQAPALEGEFIPASTNIFIPGPKVLLMGGGGSGKSHSLSTLVEAGLEVACIFTEPSGMETISDIAVANPPGKCRFHWMYIEPAKVSWTKMEAAARQINSLSFKSLAELGDIDKKDFKHWMQFVSACGNFKCAKCGKAVGPLDELNENWATCLDSLSGMNEMAMNLVVGMKPVKSPGDWGVAMDNLGRFVTTYTTGLKCLGVITAHLEKEVDPNTGFQTFQASTLGQKLAPKIGRFFSDIILSKRDGTKFTWSTAAAGIDLKVRNVPIADNQTPSFVPIVKKWHTRINYSLKAS